MPTTYTDQFWVIDPFDPPPAGTILNVFSFEIIDQNDDDLINAPSGDSVDGFDVEASYPGDTITVTLSDGSEVTITGTTFYLSDGRQVFTPTDGSVLQTSTLVDTTFVTTQGPLDVGTLGPPCFTKGTRIQTPSGLRKVQGLTKGDVVQNYAGQMVKLCMVLSRYFSSRDLAENPKLRPVRIMAGALGKGLPLCDLLVSRQHRMLVSSKITERMFGTTCVLVPAIKLTELPGIYVDEDVADVEYYHLLFEQHEVIFADGAPTESLYVGPESLKAISPEAREEILAIFPELADLNHAPQSALLLPSGKQQKQLIARHLKNHKPLLELLAD